MTKIDINEFIEKNFKVSDFTHLHWEGTFQDYIEMVGDNPKVTRNAFQRVYDMIMSYGSTSYNEYKKDISRYTFFNDPFDNGADAVYGIDVHLMKLVNFFRAAASGYGTEKRVLLLHGPVGSAKSSIARLLKKGLENYSKTDDGALYTYEWFDKEKTDILGGENVFPCPMHEEPIKLIPQVVRGDFFTQVNKGKKTYKIKTKGDICPACRHIYNEYMKKYDGEWNKIIEHIKVKRLILSEKDRIGIGTFQPKDEKNQD